MKKLELVCPICKKHKFTINDVFDDRPIIQCRKCDESFYHPVFKSIYEDAIIYGEKTGKRKIQDELKCSLGINELKYSSELVR